MTFQESNGVVVMEIESSPRVGHWQFRGSFPDSLPPSPGYYGTGYYRWIGPRRLGGPGSDSTLVYEFNITTVGGRWWIGLHSRRFGTGAGDDHNDIWMKVNSDPWHKYWQRKGTYEVWETDHRFEISGVNRDPISGLNGVPNINVGINTIRIEGRTDDFQIDRLVLVHDPAGAPTLALMQSHLSDPESTDSEGSTFEYILTDGVGASDPGSTSGTYDADSVAITDAIEVTAPSGFTVVQDTAPIDDSGSAVLGAVSGDPVGITDDAQWSLTNPLGPAATDPAEIADEGLWSLEGGFDPVAITDAVFYQLVEGFVAPPVITLPVTYSLVVVARRPQESTAPELLELGPLLGWSGLSWEEAINGEAQATVTVDPHAQIPAVTERLADLVDASELWIWRNSDLVFAGPIVGIQPQAGEAGLVATLHVRSLWHYPRRWLLAPNQTLTHTGFDQFDIVRSLIDHHQSRAFGDFGITVSTESSGVTRDRVYVGAENHNIGQRIEELAEIADGFDFLIDPETRMLMLGHPRLGVDRSGTVILDRRNIVDPGAFMSVGPDDLTAEAHAVSPGEVPLITSLANQDVRERFGLVGTFASYSDIVHQATLDAHVERLLDDRAQMYYQPGPELIPVAGADVDDFAAGDTIEMAYDYGFADLVTHRQVRRRRVTVSDLGDETMSVEFGTGPTSTVKAIRDLQRQVSELQART
jgi:hypothetical protein